MGFSISHAALRLVSGAFILNSGVGKLSLEKEHAAGLQAAASHVIPQVKDLDPERFGKLLALAEIGVGAAVLAPFIPSRLAGLLLGGFSGGLFAMYLKTPGMTEADGIRPTPAGMAMAKDIWLVGIGVALLFDRRHRPRAAVQAKLAAARAGAAARH
ncbi:hypothetical protein [Arthrobacter sp. 35W]|uniref:hypothetical protein n=1 Tax=Arthrobacter sp. 35W TaxID=1132441 RepID=UPI0003FC98EA|nr:hypothetical protein [Arthrobacter sp. 35W]